MNRKHNAVTVMLMVITMIKKNQQSIADDERKIEQPGQTAVKSRTRYPIDTHQ